MKRSEDGDGAGDCLSGRSDRQPFRASLRQGCGVRVRIICDVNGDLDRYGTVHDVVLLERKRQYGIDQIGNDPEGT